MNNYTNILKHFGQFFFKNQLKHLILHVTNHCNFRCSHCFVDFVNPKKDLKLDKYEEVSRSINDLFWLDIAGGEPFLRKDLHQIINLFKKQVVSIPTNGYLLKNIKEQIGLIDKRKTELVINFSLDGLEKNHNIIRKNPQSWSKVWTTFEAIRNIKNVKCRIITVIHDGNKHEIIPLMKIVKKSGVDFHSVILLRGDPLDPSVKLPKMDELKKLGKEIFSILDEYTYGQNSASAYFLKNYHRHMWKTSLETIEQKTQIIPCLAGKSSVVVWGNGDVSSCEMLPAIGNMDKQGLKSVLQSKKFENQIKDIKNKKCHCTHNCAMLTSILFNPKEWPNLAYRKKV